MQSKKTMRSTMLAGCLLAAALASTTLGEPVVTFTNELDEASDYPVSSRTVLPNATAGNPSINITDLGGDPNEVQIQTLITSAGAASFSLLSSAVCDPSTLGGIVAISWSMQLKRNGGNSDTPIFPALWQNNKLYVYVGGKVVGSSMTNAFRNAATTYTTVSIAAATASDFQSYDLSANSTGTDPKTNVGDHPDLSGGGLPVTFGYMAVSSTSGTAYDRRTAVRNSKITVAAFSPRRITTAYGNGADTETNEHLKETNNGAIAFMNARWNPPTSRNDQIVLRFDLSGIAGLSITNASLNLVKYRNFEVPNATMTLYGVIDGKPGDALEDWSENTLTYANASWIEQDETFDDMDLSEAYVVKLDNAFPVTGDSGDVMSSQSASLLEFLRSDKNGLVTFILTRENRVEPGQERFATKEATALLDGGGSGNAGEFAPSLVLGLHYVPQGTLIRVF